MIMAHCYRVLVEMRERTVTAYCLMFNVLQASVWLRDV